MQLSIYQVDAFAGEVFRGNPAAVCPLAHWLPDAVMQQIAAENAVAETVFFHPQADGFAIRWFTPDIEMDLCGHATLAAAHVIVRHLGYPGGEIRFDSASGPLRVIVDGTRLCLDFPSRVALPADLPAVIAEAMGQAPLAVLKSRDYVLVYEDEAAIRALRPQQAILDRINLDPGGVVVTAPGNAVDFVARYFTPQATIFEDPVTGSAFCSLIPYWAQRLGKSSLHARQLSSRGGDLWCQQLGDRVSIAGEAITYMEGVIHLPAALRQQGLNRPAQERHGF